LSVCHALSLARLRPRGGGGPGAEPLGWRDVGPQHAQQKPSREGRTWPAHKMRPRLRAGGCRARERAGAVVWAIGGTRFWPLVKVAPRLALLDEPT
jgi:hypothetical protein